MMQDSFIITWQSYQVQMMRLIAFRNMFDDQYFVREHSDNQIAVRKIVRDNETISGIRPEKAEDL